MRRLLKLFPNLSGFHEGEKLPLWKKLYLLFLIPFCVFLFGLRMLTCPTSPKAVAKKIDGLELPDGRVIKVIKVDSDAVHFTTTGEGDGEFTSGIDFFNSVKTNVEDILQLIKEIDNMESPADRAADAWGRFESKEDQ